MERIQRNPFAWLFAGPALLLLIVYLLYPTLYTIYLSFLGPLNSFIPTRFVGLDNFSRLFTADPYFWNASTFPPTGTVVNNVIWLFLFTTLTVVLGLVIAVMADKVRYESIIKSVVFLPMAISFTAAGLIWLFMYSPDPHFGIINAIITGLGGQAISFLGDTHLATYAIIIAAVWIWTGFCTVILSAGLKGIPADILEAARVDGANAWQVFTRIQVPMISTTISVVVITMVINVIKVFDLIFIMGGNQGGPLGTARVIAFTQYIETFLNGRGGYGSAIAVIMMLTVIPIMIFNVRRFRQEEAIR